MEILTGQGEKLWFLDVWKIGECRDVWRVEFQIRRQVLKQFHVESLDDLATKSGGIWSGLTSSWFSLRLYDNANASRRSVHEWWAAVQSVGLDFGSELELRRDHQSAGDAPVDWYIAHAGGCLPGFAARIGVDDFDSVLGAFASAIRRYWSKKEFDERYQRERIRLGVDDDYEQGAS